MTKVAIAEEVAERIRRSEGPIELVDARGQTIGIVHRPPTQEEIERARMRSPVCQANYRRLDATYPWLNRGGVSGITTYPGLGSQLGTGDKCLSLARSGCVVYRCSAFASGKKS